MYHIKRDFSLFTSDNLLYHINLTNTIDTIYDYTDPNIISEILINEIDHIIETISPSKKIQCTKKHIKQYTKELNDLAEIKNKYHSKAKYTDSEEDWRQFRLIRNKYNNVS